MKNIQLLLEDDEIFLLRSQVRMMQIFTAEESNEMLDNFTKKILEATNNEISDDWRKEIGKMQRALRRIKETPFFHDVIGTMTELQKRLAEEMMKEE